MKKRFRFPTEILTRPKINRFGPYSFSLIKPTVTPLSSRGQNEVDTVVGATLQGYLFTDEVFARVENFLYNKMSKGRGSLSRYEKEFLSLRNCRKRRKTTGVVKSLTAGEFEKIHLKKLRANSSVGKKKDLV